MELVRSGVIRLGDRLTELFSEWRGVDRESVTVRAFLEHAPDSRRGCSILHPRAGGNSSTTSARCRWSTRRVRGRLYRSGVHPPGVAGGTSQGIGDAAFDGFSSSGVERTTACRLPLSFGLTGPAGSEQRRRCLSTTTFGRVDCWLAKCTTTTRRRSGAPGTPDCSERLPASRGLRVWSYAPRVATLGSGPAGAASVARDHREEYGPGQFASDSGGIWCSRPRHAARECPLPRSATSGSRGRRLDRSARDRYFVLLTNRVCGGGTLEEMRAVRRAFHDALADL